MTFLIKSLVVLASLCCRATVESFASGNNRSFRLHTGFKFTSHPAAIMESISIPNNEVNTMTAHKDSGDDTEQYPIFSLPTKKSLRSKRKEFLENAQSLIIFSAFLLKSTFVQPAHATARNNISAKTQIESKSQLQDEKVSHNRKIVPISVGVASALGGATIMKKGKKEDKTAEGETPNEMLRDNLDLKEGISDSRTSKAKDLIRKANQLEQDVSAQESVLDDLKSSDENEPTNSVSLNVQVDDEKRILAAKKVAERIKDETRKAEEARKNEEDRDRLELEETLAEQIQVEYEKVEEEVEASEEVELIVAEEEIEAGIDADNVAAHDLESESVQEVNPEKVNMEEEQNNKVDERDLEKSLLVEDDDIIDGEPELKNEDETKNMANYDYSAISDPSERAFRLLVNLGMVNEHLDPDSPDYDHSNDDDFAVENKILPK